MCTFWLILYNITIVPLLWVTFQLLSIRRPKIRTGIKGRRGLFVRLKSSLSPYASKSPRFWIHNSSMGEFEQAKPLIRQMKSSFPDCLVIVTFFSPSGLEHVKEGHGADIICYLPFDTYFGARRFVRMIHPDAAIVVRHEFWPNILCRVRRENIPLVLINASIRKVHLLKRPVFRSVQRFFLGCFDVVLSVSRETLDIIHEYNLYRGTAELAGDTRYDQVVERAREAGPIVQPLLLLKGKRFCFVAGSTWPTDEQVIFPALARMKKEHLLPWIVLVPHEPTQSHLAQCESSLSQLGLTSCRFSKLEYGKQSACDVLLIDRVGILASLYALGDIACVGGGFGAGVHQVLEPAALGLAVLYGPKCRNSYEASQLEKRDVGFQIRDSETLYAYLHDFFKKPDQMEILGRKAAVLVKEKVGASERIIACLKKLISS
jgi:3-deoxy-D-manno-octulosonic-acid transferase